MQVVGNLGSLLSWSYVLNEQTRNNILSESCSQATCSSSHILIMSSPHFWVMQALISNLCPQFPPELTSLLLVCWSFRSTVLNAAESMDKLNSKHLTQRSYPKLIISPCWYKNQLRLMVFREDCLRYNSLCSVSDILKYIPGSHRITQDWKDIS